jgi:predicted DNA-binding protein
MSNGGLAMIELDLSDGIVERLEFLAKKAGLSINAFMQQAILEKMENLDDEIALEQALAEDDGTRLSLEEVRLLWKSDELV